MKAELSKSKKESSKRPAETASPVVTGTPAVPKTEAKGSVGSDIPRSWNPERRRRNGR